MGNSDYWRTVLADPVAGHQTLVDKVERMTIRDGVLVELKLHDLEQPVWVAPLTDDEIEPTTDEDWKELQELASSTNKTARKREVDT